MRATTPRQGASGGEPLARAAALCAWFVLAAVLGMGCRRDHVTHAKLPKEQASVMVSPAGAPPVDQAAGEAAAPAPAAGTVALAWTLPEGWRQSVSRGMRYATLKPPLPGRVEASVVVLPGPAGGELANVNRWRGQIGLPPVDEAGLAAVRRTLGTRAGPVSVYDFTSEGQSRSRVVVAIAVAEGNSWFLKLAGDAEPVGAAQPGFLRLLESLHVE